MFSSDISGKVNGIKQYLISPNTIGVGPLRVVPSTRWDSKILLLLNNGITSAKFITNFG